MSRSWLVVTALAAGVLAPGSGTAAAAAAPATKAKAESTKAAKGSRKAKAAKPAKKTAKAKASKPKSGKAKAKRSAKARVIVPRTRAGHADNMPRGFTWPPSEEMLAAEKACEARLDAAGIAWKPAAQEGRIVDAITLEDMTLGGVSYRNAWGGKGPYKLDCQLAVALETVGTELYALGVREVKFGSIYRWSNVRVGGKTKPFLSRHALGLAMDVVSFVDDAGRVANVKADYRNDDPLLLAIERTINESGKFRLVLTPANDPVSHSDHFHIEAASDYAAR